MVLGAVGINGPAWLADPALAMPSIIAMAVWRNLGFAMIVFLAGLQAIPTVLYEAASIDGAGRWQAFRSVTLPLLKPTIVFLTVFSSIGFLRIFDQVYNMTTNDPGGPLNSTKPLVLLIYQTAFRAFEMGYAAAQTVVLFLVLLAVSLIQLRVLRDR
jgi:multiple sugar transport system permease protein